MSWTDTVPLIVDGAEGDQDTFNTPLQALIDRTDYLKSEITAITNKSNILVDTSVLDTATVKGDLVYFDTASGSYKQSLAAWSTSYGANGDLLPADSCRVDGLVISKSASATGKLLVAGSYADSAIALKLFGVAGPTGMYYLSDTTAGGVSSTQPAISVPAVINMDGTNVMFAARLAAQPNHLHRVFSLDEGWLDITDTSFADMDIPGLAVKGYDITNDADVTALFAAYPGQMAIFDADGKLLGSSDIVSNSDNIWWLNGTTTPGVFTMFAYTPFTHGEPIIRAAGTDTPDSLTVAAVSGVLTITDKPFVTATAAASGYAISSILNRSAGKTPVISSVVQGAGITATTNTTTGVCTISSTQSVGALIEAEVVDLSNAVEEVSDPHFYYNLPASRVASIIGRCKLPQYSSGSYSVATWAWVKGITGATVVTPIVFPHLAVTMTYIPSPKGSAYVDLGTLTFKNTTLPSVNSVQDRLYYIETPSADRLACGSEGLFAVKIAHTGGSYDKRIMRFGVILYTV